ncbi:hypothetical protein ACRE_048840 [Hapsidospora chrysogenum ATCC 11550]|uniref:SWIM-type domain-containing protein n=1 Tax=Hapsidospora chrysogenum (strain ATCC 11550 / CBS 779.69 / DSM 880 / IAM 14645 / JCM 23072 / IMI 49137) TaxID=857340 RepID=A0A086T4N3_HAPC1|nr:hypothetical protein ACRE_048840 [Hapsidospora chrysogenum ATCC 11550]
MQNLPSHRQFLTSLIENLSTGQPQPAAINREPPHLIPPDRRQLLLTLHVLFPSLLLPALDLLDRRLVTHIRNPDAPGSAPLQLYVVRSLGTTLGRRRRDAGYTARSYVVRLGPWNCSCASFALDAFPPGGEISSGNSERAEQGCAWFGGMSRDGLEGVRVDVPCCKHLLACLLAERWNDLLGGYVESKEVSREEMAGIVAGG